MDNASAVPISEREQMLALVRFHWAAGARVALRANAIVLGLVVFVFGSAPDGLATFRAFVLEVVSRDRSGGGSAILAVIALAFAATAVPRVLLGATGWMRGLPASARPSWRAAVIAICAAQLAVASFIPVAALLAALLYRVTLSPAKIVSLFVMIVVIAATVLPVRRARTRLIAAAGVGLAVLGTWPAIVGSLVCLALADATSPALAGVRRRRRARRAITTRESSALLFWVPAAWRAMRLEGIAASGAFPAIVGSFAYFIARNNPSLAPSTAATVVRVCGMLSLGFFAAMLSNGLLTSRQPWPWARSLPWSSTYRVLADTCVLGVPLCIVPLGLMGANISQAGIVAALVPLAATSGAAAVRGGSKRQTGAAGECMAVVCIAGGFTAVWPSLVLVALLVAPLFVLLGARRERNAIATRWTELHHDAAGDPGWLTVV